MAFQGAHDAVFDGSGPGPDGGASRGWRNSGPGDAAGSRSGAEGSRGADGSAAERPLILA
jgi:hypothetical protein